MTTQPETQTGDDAEVEVIPPPRAPSEDSPLLPAKRDIQSSTGAAAPIIPRNLNDLALYADWIIRADMVPNGISVEADPQKLNLIYPDKATANEKQIILSREADKRTKSRVMIIIEKGLEVGMGPMTALSTIMIVNNRACVWGDGATALCQRDGKFGGIETVYDGTRLQPDWKCTVKVWRKGVEKPFIGIFTYATAVKARLITPRKRPWIDYPDRMMFNRARAFALRDGFADCLMGLAIREEVEDMPEDPANKPTPNTDFLRDGAPQITTAATASGGARQIENKPTPAFDTLNQPAKEAEPVLRNEPSKDGEKINTAPGPDSKSTDSQGSAGQVNQVPEKPAEKAPESAQEGRLTKPPAQEAPPEVTTQAPAPSAAPPSAAAKAEPPAKPIPKEPPIPSKRAKLEEYAKALIAWIPHASDEALADHQARAKGALAIIREDRPLDWQKYNDVLELRLEDKKLT